MNTLRVGTLVILAALTLTLEVRGHGGVFRGPGTTAGPGGPTSGGATSGGPSTSGGGAKNTDVAAWDQWWSFNRDQYLALKDAVFEHDRPVTGDDDFYLGHGSKRTRGPRSRPTEPVLREEVVPALRQALLRQLDTDIITGVLLALAKIGDPPGGPKATAGILRGYLDHKNQEVHETAAIALGILAQSDAAPLLSDLMLDTKTGRAAVGRTKVPQRTRAFAAYGLGLIGYGAETSAVKSFVVHQLAKAIDAGDKPTRDVIVAAILSMGLVRLEPAVSRSAAGDAAPRVSASRAGQLEFLLDVWANSRLDARVRSHVPVALARLAAGAYPSYKGRLADTFVATIARRSRAKDVVQHGVLLACGLLGDNDLDPEDVALRSALNVSLEESDRLGRNLAVLALARVAGREGTGMKGEVPAEVRSRLLKQLARGGTAARPWAALGLGLLERGNVAAGRPLDESTRLALHHAFKNAASPSEQGALAIALGLVKHEPAAEKLIERTTNGDENVRGYAAIALGLMGAHQATPTLRSILARKRYMPGVLREAAIALAMLGDGHSVSILLERLGRAKFMFEQLVLASALGFIGDARSVGPLVEILNDKRISETTRAFAAVALGMVCDKEPYPWNSKIAADVLWWQAPPTLHDPVSGKGILDTL